MKRVMALILVLLLAFYVGWPAWSGYRIKTALQNSDPDALAAKIDFPSVRASMRPLVTQKVGEGFDRYQAQAGPTGALIMTQLKQEAIPRIVDMSLSAMLTPQMLLRVFNDGGTVKASLEKIVREQMGRGLPGGAGGTVGAAGGVPPGVGDLLGRVFKGGMVPLPSADTNATPSTTSVGGEKREVSLSNIKSFSFNGPLSFRMGVAKDAASAEPDVTAEMSFVGGDWKLTGLVPRLQ